jgi:hypothetical protein
MRFLLAGLGAAAVIVFVAVEGIWLFSHSSSQETSPIAMATSTIQADTDTYTINLAYPKFGIERADIQVQAIVDRAVDEFKAIPPNPTPIAAKNELDGQFTPINQGPDILSALLEIYQFTGGAHGATVAYGLNFHADGSAVTLDQALALIGKNLQQVSDAALGQLTERFEMVQFPEGATPTPENYATFVVSKDSVTFIFQQYQVEAYAAGMPQVTFPRVK